ncbi:ASCH domain-containing protein [Candidatus Parcubacteria bacterium]|jgi:hypothetical protein|nr:ASCH domain-containing protein [Candidatus Parcubacteria bacterium]
MKTLKFHPSLVELILEGSKTTTWRLWDDKNLSVDDEISFLDSYTKTEFAQAIITEVKEKTFAELTEDDRDGHEKYSSDEKMYQSFSKHYVGKKINEDTKVKIIKFKLK